MKVLVLHCTGLHLGYLGCYGNEWIETPHIDRLAAEGVVFDQHFAECLGAGRSAWTGRYRFPDTDGAVSPPRDPELLRTLLEKNGVTLHLPQLPARRYMDKLKKLLRTLTPEKRSVCWLDLPSLLPPWTIPQAHLERYFVEPTEEETDPEDVRRVGTAHHSDTLGGAHPTEEPLTPLLGPPIGPIDVRDFHTLDCLHYTYAAAVTALDALLGALLEELQRQHLDDDVLLILTGDRGLALGEHGIVGDHRPWLHDEVVHQPLIVRLPQAQEAGRRVAALTQTVDLLPTLLDVYGLSEVSAHGLSLLPLLHGESQRWREYVCAGWSLGGRVEWALQTAQWKFVLPVRTTPDDLLRGPQLFVKPDDRWEVNSLVQHHLELVENLEKSLREFVAATQQPGPFQAPTVHTDG